MRDPTFTTAALVGALPKAHAFFVATRLGSLALEAPRPAATIRLPTAPDRSQIRSGLLARRESVSRIGTVSRAGLRRLTGSPSALFVSGGDSGASTTKMSAAVSAVEAGEGQPKRVLVPVADGSEEIESVTIIDTLVRAGALVTVASVGDEKAVSPPDGRYYPDMHHGAFSALSIQTSGEVASMKE